MSLQGKLKIVPLKSINYEEKYPESIISYIFGEEFKEFIKDIYDDVKISDWRQISLNKNNKEIIHYLNISGDSFSFERIDVNMNESTITLGRFSKIKHDKLLLLLTTISRRNKLNDLKDL
jgi:hypothetical protein